MDEFIFDEHFRGNIFERKKILEMLNILENREKEDFYLMLKADEYNKCFNGYYTLKEIIFYYKLFLSELIDCRVRESQIVDFQGSRIEEVSLLTQHITRQLIAKMPKWLQKLTKEKAYLT